MPATSTHTFITMADGVRLAATLYLPDGEGPWPAILEALPYRKDDLTASYRTEYVRLSEAGYV
ncbi:MAG TPA: CocE/NonD family hydrolase, partial [Actinomycetota bacterium]